MIDVKKILVIRLSSFGDIVLTFPFLNELRRLYPDTQIDYLVKEQYSELVRLHKFVDNIISFSDNLKDNLNKNNYDVVFDLQANFKSSRIIPSNRKVFNVRKETWKKHLLVYTKINLLQEPIPVYRKYLNALKEFNSTAKTEFSNSAQKLSVTDYVSGKYAVLSPSSKHFTKRFPKEFYVDILKDANIKFVLTGDNNHTDKEICGYLVQNLKNSINLCGKLSYSELAGVLKDAQFVVCNDSGVFHLAEALGKKTFVTFGSTVREFGFFPQLATTEVFEILGLKCRPCSHIGRSKCPKAHFKCMNMIDNELIKKRIMRCEE
ncbi:MAG: glycosyltransferase family 9 protein [Ignavibacteria bacterium]